MDDDDNIKKLPVKFRPHDEERTLMRPYEVCMFTPCSHTFVSYIVDASEAEVTCGRCKAKLNPMWVLERLANEDRRMKEAHEQYTDEMQRLGERSKTKCQHCGKMTHISRAEVRKTNEGAEPAPVCNSPKRPPEPKG